MTIEAMVWALEQHLEDAEGAKGSSTKFVLVVLGNFANGDWLSYPGPTTVGELALLNERQVRRAFARLVELGLITDTGERRGRSTVWRLEGADTVSGKRRRARKAAGQEDADTVSGTQSDTVSAPSTNEPDTVSSQADTVSSTSGHGVRPLKEGTSFEPTGTGATRPRDELFEAIVEGCGFSIDQLTDTARGHANRAAKELRGVGAAPSEIRAFCALWGSERREFDLNPGVITKHWPAFKAGQLFRRSVVVNGRIDVRDPERDRRELEEHQERELEAEKLQRIAERLGIDVADVGPAERRRYLELLADDFDAQGRTSWAERTRVEAAAIEIPEAAVTS